MKKIFLINFIFLVGILGLFLLSTFAQETASDSPPTISQDDINEFVLMAFEGKKDQVESFLSNGIPVNATSKDGYTALYRATVRGHLEIVKLLLANGAEINVVTSTDHHSSCFSCTPLMAATTQGHFEIVKLFVSNGADVNAKDKKGFTVLMLACKESRSPKIVEFLLSKGAEVNAVNSQFVRYYQSSDSVQNTTALYWALTQITTDNVIKIVDLLLSSGADMNLNVTFDNGNENTILSCAGPQNQKEGEDPRRKRLVKLLEEHRRQKK